jgi:hypothetical protein
MIGAVLTCLVNRVASRLLQYRLGLRRPPGGCRCSATFFMTDAAVRYLPNRGGFELGVGPSIIVRDAGAAKALTTTTA